MNLDMQWFSTHQICDILHRFDRIHIVGDSMMRHLSQGFLVLLREDLSTGARATWKNDNPERLDCSCRMNFDDTKYGDWSVSDSEKLALMDPGSIKCPEHLQPASIHCTFRTPNSLSRTSLILYRQRSRCRLRSRVIDPGPSRQTFDP